jgi:hypothetical protein
MLKNDGKDIELLQKYGIFRTKNVLNPAHLIFLCKPTEMFYQWLSFFVDLAEKPWEELATLFFSQSKVCTELSILFDETAR